MAHKLTTALVLLLAITASTDASVSPTESPALQTTPVFPTDQILLQQRVERLEADLQTAQQEQQDAVIAMNGLLTAIEKLQTRMDTADQREAERQQSETVKTTTAATQPQQSGQWVQQSYCTVDRLGRKTCHQRMVWQARGN